MYKNLTIVALIGLFFAGQASADSHTDPDFNDDGTVGIPDFLEFVNHFGTSRGDARYDAKYDLDNNGAIGVSDFLIFVDSFGSEVPPSGGSGSGGGGESSSPDLIVESPSVSNSTLTTGQSFTLSATVRNQGTGSSASTTLRYYRSSDATISTSDTEVGTDSVNGLSASGTSDESISLTAPSSAGTYYYGACVESVSGESNTDNNCSDGVRVTVSSGGSGPDDSLEPPRSAFPGLRVRSDGYFTNTNFTIFGILIWVSCAKEINWFHPYTVVSSRWQKQEGTSWVNVPGTRLVGQVCGYQAEGPGTYRLVVVMSSGRQFFSENTFTATSAAAGGGGSSGGGSSGGGSSGSPDLVIDSLSVSDSSPGVEEYFTLSATVRNQGNGSGTYSFTTLRYYQSADATISTSDTEVGWNHVTRLDPSETSEESAYLNAPSSAGTYYYGACVEAVTGESNTNNNCSSAVTVTVQGSDLIVESLSVSDSSPDAGEYFTLSATVRNQGNGSGTYSFTTLRYYQSADATISTSDTEVGWNHVTRLDPSETSEESAYLNAPSSAGTYYYGACVEAVTGESNTNNNCSSAVTVTVQGSDLIVESLSVSDSSPDAGEYFTLSATVRNQGGGRSASTTLRYYQSTDMTITTGDTEVATDYVTRLDPSETSKESGRVRAPASPGTYYYGACIESSSGESNTNNNCSTGVRVTVQ